MNRDVYDWGHGPRLTALGLSKLANRLNQRKEEEKIAKDKWKMYSHCGIITDFDFSFFPLFFQKFWDNFGLNWLRFFDPTQSFFVSGQQ